MGLTVTNPLKLPWVEVRWNDANTGNDDVVTKENIHLYHKPTVVHTVGWLFQEDDKGITLVNEFYDECYRGRTFIYRPMIISVTPFTMSKARVKKTPPAPKPAASADADGGKG
jgi:hypothetical protein